ncbi:unnamed protein product [Porites lobata]|uniref:SET domain-containing protein n=1 Tax=Porites lobata TaxID=104759 RepID=A0ABN8N8W8_9CNID|nr:unnamed protein product [Porites lobata]
MHKHDKAVVRKASQLPLALRSLPPEVGLCTSTIPGQECGICAKRKIPVGAWIGPYEGKFLKPKELSSTTDTSYMWEIFQNGELTGYIDGSDVKLTSWMRFIRSARHKREQNLFAFQYLGRIFYRAFKDILPGEEMLVWYDEKYPQYLGIPWTIFDLAAAVPPVSTSIQVKRSSLHPSQDERLCYSKSVANLGENPVKHIQKNGNPPTITRKCKYSLCKKRTSATTSCSRGKNAKSPHRAYGAQVPQRQYRSTTPVVSFRATNQQRTYAFIQGNDSGYCPRSFNDTVTMDNHI